MRCREKDARPSGAARPIHLTRDPEVANRGVRIEDVAGALVHLPDGRSDLVIRVMASFHVVLSALEPALVQPNQALEIAGVADVHGVGDRPDRRARLELAGRQIRRHHVVRIRGCHEPLDGRARALREQPGGEVPEIAAWRADDRRFGRPGLTAQLGDSLEVIDHLRQQPADVDGVRRRQRDLAAQARVGERVLHQFLAVVEAAGHGVRADVGRGIVVEHRELGLLRRAHAAFRVQNHDARAGDTVECVRHGAAGIARCRGQHRHVGAEGGHQSRHHARADVLERQRGPVKQFEREDAGLDLNQRNREIERFVHDCRQRRRIDRAGGERLQDAKPEFGQRTGREAGNLVGGPCLDRIGHVQPAIGRQPVEQRGAEGRRGRLTTRRDKPHADTTCAPRVEIDET